VPAIGDDTAETAQKVLDLIQEKFGEEIPPLITIGDVTTESFLRIGAPIHLAVIDGKTRRGVFDSAAGNFQAEVEVDNPAGTITPEARDAILAAISEDASTLIRVNGEEDLLVIPAVVGAPFGDIIMYGQPPQTDLDPPLPAGVVYFPVTPQIKQVGSTLLEQFCPS
jgi:hypothetical protein